ncbi:hypothetical protein O181_010709 [Austropuccinia psidii MF-1]|uniref:Uncharacterized protein n=1 Tax=Austropuccinia psidii MF-1 TaxID=1389203 RepID=A0A9Q3GL48_9BASI|nr:hypothetical protein [Austropuccinia psidii MF-1]
MLRWKIAIEEYKANMTILYKEGKIYTNAYCLSRCPLENVQHNPANNHEVAAKIPIHLMEIDRERNFKLSEWAPEFGTSDSDNTEPEWTETPILGISSPDLLNKFSVQ